MKRTNVKEVVASELIVAHSDAPPMFDTAEEIFDLVSLALVECEFSHKRVGREIVVLYNPLLEPTQQQSGPPR
jgi:hypothetical protein